MGCIGGFVTMLMVTAGVFLLLNTFLPWWIAAPIAVALLFGWYKANQRAALRGSSRTVLGAYFKSRRSGASHADSLRFAVETRYLAVAKREDLLGHYVRVVRDQPVVAEAEQVRTLVRILHWEQFGYPPASASEVATEHERNLNEELARAESKYGVALNHSGPAPDGSFPVESKPSPRDPVGIDTVVIRCKECGQQMRVHSGKGRIRVRCSTCGEKGEYTS